MLLNVFINVLVPNSSSFLKLPIAAFANNGFSKLYPLSSLILPVSIIRIKLAAAGSSALAPKLLYWPEPKKYCPYPFDAVKLELGKNGLYPFESLLLYSNLKYCGCKALSLFCPPKLELNLPTAAKLKVSPAVNEEVITWTIS